MLHIFFAANFAVHFYCNLIVLTTGDIPSHLAVYHLVILLIFLQTTYRVSKVGHSTCLTTVANHSSKIYPYSGEREIRLRLENWDNLISLHIKSKNSC